jgi:hypothetical protein
MTDHKISMLFSLMIPSDQMRQLPSGSEIEELMIRINAGQLSNVVQASERVVSQIENLTTTKIEDLTPTQFEAFVRTHRATVDTDVRLIGDELMRSYYTDPRVQDAIGGSSRAPFPAGFRMPENNLDLLEEVFNRGSIYREVPNE